MDSQQKYRGKVWGWNRRAPEEVPRQWLDHMSRNGDVFYSEPYAERVLKDKDIAELRQWGERNNWFISINHYSTYWPGSTVLVRFSRYDMGKTIEIVPGVVR